MAVLHFEYMLCVVVKDEGGWAYEPKHVFLSKKEHIINKIIIEMAPKKIPDQLLQALHALKN